MTAPEVLSVTIAVRRKPLLYVAAVLYALDRRRGRRLHRLGNRLVDACVSVTT